MNGTKPINKYNDAQQNFRIQVYRLYKAKRELQSTIHRWIMVIRSIDNCPDPINEALLELLKSDTEFQAELFHASRLIEEGKVNVETDMGRCVFIGLSVIFGLDIAYDAFNVINGYHENDGVSQYFLTGEFTDESVLNEARAMMGIRGLISHVSEFKEMISKKMIDDASEETLQKAMERCAILQYSSSHGMHEMTSLTENKKKYLDSKYEYYKSRIGTSFQNLLKVEQEGFQSITTGLLRDCENNLLRSKGIKNVTTDYKTRIDTLPGVFV